MSVTRAMQVIIIYTVDVAGVGLTCVCNSDYAGNNYIDSCLMVIRTL